MATAKATGSATHSPLIHWPREFNPFAVSNQMIADLIYKSDQFAIDGLWSGTEGRYKLHYIGIIPESRYRLPKDEPILEQLRVEISKVDFSKIKRTLKQWRKPVAVKILSFNAGGYRILKHELREKGIVQVVRRGFIAHPSDGVYSFVPRVLSWVNKNRHVDYDLDPPLIEHVQVSREFIGAAIREYDRNHAALEYFFQRQFK